MLDANNSNANGISSKINNMEFDERSGYLSGCFDSINVLSIFSVVCFDVLHLIRFDSMIFFVSFHRVGGEQLASICISLDVAFFLLYHNEKIELVFICVIYR